MGLPRVALQNPLLETDHIAPRVRGGEKNRKTEKSFRYLGSFNSDPYVSDGVALTCSYLSIGGPLDPPPVRRASVYSQWLRR